MKLQVSGLRGTSISMSISGTFASDLFALKATATVKVQQIKFVWLNRKAPKESYIPESWNWLFWAEDEYWNTLKTEQKTQRRQQRYI